MLVSKQLTDELARFQIGAALPRISSRDFFALRLPLPPLAIQDQWAKKLFDLSAVVRKARKHIESFPDQLDSSLNEMISAA
jgi:restriction endonuclease S subunit